MSTNEPCICGNCCYWHMGPGRSPKENTSGASQECHANPPIVMYSPEVGKLVTLFPLVKEGDVCGMWDSNDQS